MTTNVFEALLGREDITWHALWRFFHWLCDPDEGHGLGRAFQDELTTFAFGRPLTPAKMKCEFRFDDATISGGKWPDFVIAAPDFGSPSHFLLMEDVDRRRCGDSRKLTNLSVYLRHAATSFPTAAIRLVVLSNASHDGIQERLQKALGSGVTDSRTSIGWKVLPLRLTGEWVGAHLAASHPHARQALSDYVAWTTIASDASVAVSKATP